MVLNSFEQFILGLFWFILGRIGSGLVEFLATLVCCTRAVPSPIRKVNKKTPLSAPYLSVESLKPLSLTKLSTKFMNASARRFQRLVGCGFEASYAKKASILPILPGLNLYKIQQYDKLEFQLRGNDGMAKYKDFGAKSASFSIFPGFKAY